MILNGTDVSASVLIKQSFPSSLFRASEREHSLSQKSELPV
jgi:hypothetical protein